MNTIKNNCVWNLGLHQTCALHQVLTLPELNMPEFTLKTCICHMCWHCLNWIEYDVRIYTKDLYLPYVLTQSKLDVGIYTEGLHWIRCGTRKWFIGAVDLNWIRRLSLRRKHWILIRHFQLHPNSQYWISVPCSNLHHSSIEFARYLYTQPHSLHCRCEKREIMRVCIVIFTRKRITAQY